MSQREKLEKELGTAPPPGASVTEALSAQREERARQSTLRDEFDASHDSASDGTRRQSIRLRQRYEGEGAYPDGDNSTIRYPTRNEANASTTRIQTRGPRKTTSISKAKNYLNPSPIAKKPARLPATARSADDRPFPGIDDETDFPSPPQTNRTPKRKPSFSVLDPPRQQPRQQQPPTTRVKKNSPIPQSAVRAFRSQPSPHVRKPVPKPTLEPRQPTTELGKVETCEQSRPDPRNVPEPTKEKDAPISGTPEDSGAIDIDMRCPQRVEGKRSTRPAGKYWQPTQFSRHVQTAKKRMEKKTTARPTPREEEEEIDGQDGQEVMEDLESSRTNGTESEVQFVRETGGEVQKERTRLQKIRRNDDPAGRRRASVGTVQQPVVVGDTARGKLVEVRDETPSTVEHDAQHIRNCFEQHLIKVCGIVMLPDNGIDHSVLRQILVPLLDDLKLLQSINLRRNSITHLPNSFEKSCARIKTLDLGNNRLKFLPKWMFHVCAKTLKQLILPNNNLDQLPPGIQEMQYLEVLDLSHNRFAELEGGIGLLRRLRILNLRNNDLLRLPDDIGLENKNLMSMDISDNVKFATGLPDAMQECAYKMKTFSFVNTKLYLSLSKKQYNQVHPRDLIMYLISLDEKKVREMFLEKETLRQRREGSKKER